MFLPQTKADQSHRQPSHFVKEGRTEEGGVGGISGTVYGPKK